MSTKRSAAADANGGKGKKKSGSTTTRRGHSREGRREDNMNNGSAHHRFITDETLEVTTGAKNIAMMIACEAKSMNLGNEATKKRPWMEDLSFREYLGIQDGEDVHLVLEIYNSTDPGFLPTDVTPQPEKNNSVYGEIVDAVGNLLNQVGDVTLHVTGLEYSDLGRNQQDLYCGSCAAVYKMLKSYGGRSMLAIKDMMWKMSLSNTPSLHDFNYESVREAYEGILRTMKEVKPGSTNSELRESLYTEGLPNGMVTNSMLNSYVRPMRHYAQRWSGKGEEREHVAKAIHGTGEIEFGDVREKVGSVSKALFSGIGRGRSRFDFFSMEYSDVRHFVYVWMGFFVSTVGKTQIRALHECLIAPSPVDSYLVQFGGMGDYPTEKSRAYVSNTQKGEKQPAHDPDVEDVTDQYKPGGSVGGKKGGDGGPAHAVEDVIQTGQGDVGVDVVDQDMPDVGDVGAEGQLGVDLEDNGQEDGSSQGDPESGYDTGATTPDGDGSQSSGEEAAVALKVKRKRAPAKVGAVRKSTLERASRSEPQVRLGKRGRGLFAERRYGVGEVVTFYNGKLLAASDMLGDDFNCIYNQQVKAGEAVPEEIYELKKRYEETDDEEERQNIERMRKTRKIIEYEPGDIIMTENFEVPVAIDAIDGPWDEKALGRYVNTGGSQKNNCRFILQPGELPYLVTTKPVMEGNEFLTGYGSLYFAKLKKYVKSHPTYGTDAIRSDDPYNKEVVGGSIALDSKGMDMHFAGSDSAGAGVPEEGRGRGGDDMDLGGEGSPAIGLYNVNEINELRTRDIHGFGKRPALVTKVNVPELFNEIGLYASEDLKKYTFIAEYPGDKVSKQVLDEMDIRELAGTVPAHRGAYIARIDDETYVDGFMSLNTPEGDALTANHYQGLDMFSCRQRGPNCSLRVVRDRVVLISAREIANGEQLLLDYGPTYWGDKYEKSAEELKYCKDVGKVRMTLVDVWKRANLFVDAMEFVKGSKRDAVLASLEVARSVVMEMGIKEAIGKVFFVHGLNAELVACALLFVYMVKSVHMVRVPGMSKSDDMKFAIEMLLRSVILTEVPVFNWLVPELRPIKSSEVFAHEVKGTLSSLPRNIYPGDFSEVDVDWAKRIVSAPWEVSPELGTDELPKLDSMSYAMIKYDGKKQDVKVLEHGDVPSVLVVHYKSVECMMMMSERGINCMMSVAGRDSLFMYSHKRTAIEMKRTIQDLSFPWSDTRYPCFYSSVRQLEHFMRPSVLYTPLLMYDQNVVEWKMPSDGNGSPSVVLKTDWAVSIDAYLVAQIQHEPGDFIALYDRHEWESPYCLGKFVSKSERDDESNCIVSVSDVNGYLVLIASKTIKPRDLIKITIELAMRMADPGKPIVNRIPVPKPEEERPDYRSDSVVSNTEEYYPSNVVWCSRDTCARAGVAMDALANMGIVQNEETIFLDLNAVSLTFATCFTTKYRCRAVVVVDPAFEEQVKRQEDWAYRRDKKQFRQRIKVLYPSGGLKRSLLGLRVAYDATLYGKAGTTAESIMSWISGDLGRTMEDKDHNKRFLMKDISTVHIWDSESANYARRQSNMKDGYEASLVDKCFTCVANKVCSMRLNVEGGKISLVSHRKPYDCRGDGFISAKQTVISLLNGRKGGVAAFHSKFVQKKKQEYDQVTDTFVLRTVRLCKVVLEHVKTKKAAHPERTNITVLAVLPSDMQLDILASMAAPFQPLRLVVVLEKGRDSNDLRKGDEVTEVYGITIKRMFPRNAIDYLQSPKVKGDVVGIFCNGFSSDDEMVGDMIAHSMASMEDSLVVPSSIVVMCMPVCLNGYLPTPPQRGGEGHVYDPHIAVVPGSGLPERSVKLMGGTKLDGIGLSISRDLVASGGVLQDTDCLRGVDMERVTYTGVDFGVLAVSKPFIMYNSSELYDPTFTTRTVNNTLTFSMAFTTDGVKEVSGYVIYSNTILKEGCSDIFDPNRLMVNSESRDRLWGVVCGTRGYAESNCCYYEDSFMSNGKFLVHIVRDSKLDAEYNQDYGFFTTCAPDRMERRSYKKHKVTLGESSTTGANKEKNRTLDEDNNNNNSSKKQRK